MWETWGLENTAFLEDEETNSHLPPCHCHISPITKRAPVPPKASQSHVLSDGRALKWATGLSIHSNVHTRSTYYEPGRRGCNPCHVRPSLHPQTREKCGLGETGDPSPALISSVHSWAVTQVRGGGWSGGSAHPTALARLRTPWKHLEPPIQHLSLLNSADN